MSKLKMSLTIAFLLAAALPAARADHDRRAAAPAATHYSTDRHPVRYDRYRYEDGRGNRHYRNPRHYPRYRHRPHARYVYRPFVAPFPVVRPYRYTGRGYGPYRRYYRHHGDGIWLTPGGLTIFLDLDD